MNVRSKCTYTKTDDSLLHASLNCDCMVSLACYLGELLDYYHIVGCSFATKNFNPLLNYTLVLNRIVVSLIINVCS